MKKLFEPGGFVTARDGTLISAFLSPLDGSTINDADHLAMGDVSITAGKLEPGTSSLIHVHPIVSQTIYVCAGELVVRMKSPGDDAVFEQRVGTNQAMVIQPETLLQLSNDTPGIAELLYIVAPAYVLLNSTDGNVTYDDAIVLEESWQALQAVNYRIPALQYSLERVLAEREAARRSLSAFYQR